MTENTPATACGVFWADDVATTKYAIGEEDSNPVTTRYAIGEEDSTPEPSATPFPEKTPPPMTTRYAIGEEG
ncbi:MAG: hypothetical protein JXR70_08245 [Spirochaetales bacterium]|nr:hypothetical protein [Spirochaetales bacterium]